MVSFYQVVLPPNHAPHNEPSDVLRNFIFSANLAAQDITNDTATSSSATQILSALAGSPLKQTILLAVQLAGTTTLSATGSYGYPMISAVETSTLTAGFVNAPDNFTEPILGFLEINLNMQSDLNAIDCDITLDAELQPLPGETLDKEIFTIVSALVAEACSFAQKIHRPVVRFWLRHSHPGSGLHEVVTTELSQNGFHCALAEIQGYIPAEKHILPLPPRYSFDFYRDHNPNKAHINSLLNLFELAESHIPTGTLSVSPQPWTTQRLKQSHVHTVDRGNQTTTVIVLFDDHPIAFSEIINRAGSHPTVVEQGATFVHPQHQGRGIGQALKAQAIRSAIELWPETRKIYTDMEISNTRILKINEQFGFHSIARTQAWQKTLS
ncbi:acetyltransferase [Corynebacterium kutscheri]|uniref:Acetyltransferase n=1 Tax=Corynebacterium kutscheri TaxID=35755 RepID=A0A0F6QZY6_9CORY|nr:GNAT family N-acetyltransferase [Corynebacterium kutscheri]AKE41407.1 Acetyltransferase (GNAT) domain [Corynebacterium kutscheri]VEH08684.1 acetyltransferase [Corynebacterium kutscheri]VEH09731.1 acetyltransferase [Corynebacterium kutscheri]VEH79814.1 acetyltransferase [Corynebacterium kutscheri]